MKQSLLHITERLRSSFWLVPAVMLVCAITLAHILLAVDQHLFLGDFPGLRWLRLRDPDSARSLLSTIASSTITVAGTVFSITTVALTLASSQFGPHLVRNFIRDRGTQASLGIFLSTFVYALMIMRGIDTGKSSPDSHDISVNTALLLALISIAYLIYFIHNVAQSIQVDNITFNINKEFSAALEQQYPTDDSHDPLNKRVNRNDINLGDDFLIVPTNIGGYVQRIDRQKLIDWASENDCCVRTECHPGTYLNHWSNLATIYSPPRTIDSDTINKQIQSAITVGSQPTAEQDIIYSIRQLSQIAVRALSPGVNDPYTAYSCIDRLVDGIGKVLQRPELPNSFHDEQKQLRLITHELDFADILAAALDEIREYGRTSGVVMRHLLNTLTELAEICSREEDKRALKKITEHLREDCKNFVEDKFDTEIINKKLTSIQDSLTRKK